MAPRVLFPRWENLKILGAVVSFVSVDVMNNLAG